MIYIYQGTLRNSVSIVRPTSGPYILLNHFALFAAAASAVASGLLTCPGGRSTSSSGTPASGI